MSLVDYLRLHHSKCEYFRVVGCGTTAGSTTNSSFYDSITAYEEGWVVVFGPTAGTST